MNASIHSFSYSLIMHLLVCHIFLELLCARLQLGFRTQLPPVQAASTHPEWRTWQAGVIWKFQMGRPFSLLLPPLLA